LYIYQTCYVTYLHDKRVLGIMHLAIDPQQARGKEKARSLVNVVEYLTTIYKTITTITHIYRAVVLWRVHLDPPEMLHAPSLSSGRMSGW